MDQGVQGAAAPRSAAERIRLLHSPWPKRSAAGGALRILNGSGSPDCGHRRVRGPELVAQLAAGPEVLGELGSRPPPVDRVLALPAPERHEVPWVVVVADQHEPLRARGLALR